MNTQRKKKFGCLKKVGIFAVLIFGAILIQKSQYKEDKPKVIDPKTNRQAKTIRTPVENTTSSKPLPLQRFSQTKPQPKVYSPADFPINGILLTDIIQVKGIVKNVRHFSHSKEVMFTLEDKGDAILVFAATDRSTYRNGKVLTVKGQYFTTKTIELVMGIKIDDRNIPVIWIDH